MTQIKTLAEWITNFNQARRNCASSGNSDWEAEHESRLAWVEKNLLPSGAGFDGGTKFKRGRSDNANLYFITSFHHMNEQGFYTHWSELVIVAKSTFAGIEIDFVKNSHKEDERFLDYVAEVFEATLLEKYSILPSGALKHVGKNNVE